MLDDGGQLIGRCWWEAQRWRRWSGKLTASRSTGADGKQIDGRRRQVCRPEAWGVGGQGRRCQNIDVCRLTDMDADGGRETYMC